METRTSPVFGPGDVGCWIDGAHSMDHWIDKLRTMVSPIPGVQPSLLDDLGSDDAGVMYDAIYAAIDLLGDHTADGLIWITSCGDLLLVPEDQED